MFKDDSQTALTTQRVLITDMNQNMYNGTTPSKIVNYQIMTESYYLIGRKVLMFVR
jgi:hypothetical protein